MKTRDAPANHSRSSLLQLVPHLLGDTLHRRPHHPLELLGCRHGEPPPHTHGFRPELRRHVEVPGRDLTTGDVVDDVDAGLVPDRAETGSPTGMS